MIWLAWHQHRTQALLAAIGLALLAGLLIPTGVQMHHAFADTGLANCLAAMSRAELIENVPTDPVTSLPDCQVPASRFTAQFDGYVMITVLFLVLPVLVGLFFGAPLVAREVEHGTHRLVWTQGVTRRRWALVKIGTVALSALAVAAGYAALVTWWMIPMSLANAGRFDRLIFDMQGIAPVGYTVFAVALGILAGTVWRRVLPAMVVTLAGFLVARTAVAISLRPHFLPMREHRHAIASDQVYNVMRGDWILDRDVYDSAGRLVVSGGDVTCGAPPTAGPVPTAGPDACHPEWGPEAYNVLLYQPADRFWLFQYLETGLFVALAVVCLAVAVHLIRRRIS